MMGWHWTSMGHRNAVRGVMLGGGGVRGGGVGLLHGKAVVSRTIQTIRVVPT